MKIFSVVAALLFSNIVLAHDHGSHSKSEYTKCPAERSQMCTREYRPVCASVEVHCIKSPCRPIKRTYANGCEACADKQVLGYVPRACDDAINPSDEGPY